MSQFGELSKSALQIWRAFQISSPNLDTILMDSGVFFLTDIHQTPKKSLGNLLDDDIRSQIGELSRSALQCGYYQTTNRPPDNRHPMESDGPCWTYDRFPDSTQIKLSHQIVFSIYKKRGIVVISYNPA